MTASEHRIETCFPRISIEVEPLCNFRAVGRMTATVRSSGFAGGVFGFSLRCGNKSSNSLQDKNPLMNSFDDSVVLTAEHGCSIVYNQCSISTLQWY